MARDELREMIVEAIEASEPYHWTASAVHGANWSAYVVMVQHEEEDDATELARVHDEQSTAAIELVADIERDRKQERDNG